MVSNLERKRVSRQGFGVSDCVVDLVVPRKRNKQPCEWIKIMNARLPECNNLFMTFRSRLAGSSSLLETAGLPLQVIPCTSRSPSEK